MKILELPNGKNPVLNVVAEHVMVFYSLSGDTEFVMHDGSVFITTIPVAQFKRMMLGQNEPGSVPPSPPPRPGPHDMVSL